MKNINNFRNVKGYINKDNKKLKTDVLEWCDIISMESKKMSRDTKINI